MFIEIMSCIVCSMVYFPNIGSIVYALMFHSELLEQEMEFFSPREITTKLGITLKGNL